MRTLIVLLLAFSPSLAEACYRCGNYRSCSYVKAAPVYVRPAVANTNVYVVQNNAPPLIGQGATQYRSAGFQAAAYNFFDRNAYLASVNEIHKAVNSGLALSMTRADSLAQGFAAADSPAVEVLARAQAAETTLNALGMNITNAPPGAQNNAVVINRDGAGRLQVFRLDEQQIARINGQVNGYPNGGQYPQGEPRSGDPYPMLTAFCAKCHDPRLPEPKGGLYIGDHDSVAQGMRAKFFSIVDQVTSGKMPPPDQLQPSREEKARLLDEVQAIIKRYSNGLQPQQQPAQQPLNDQPPPPPTPAT